MKIPNALVLLIMSISLFSYVQTDKPKPDSRLKDYLNPEQIEILLNNNPDLIEYYNYFLDQSYLITTLPSDKFDNKSKSITTPLLNGKIDTKKLNVLVLQLKQSENQRTYYQVNGTLEVIVMLSNKEFMEKYNLHRKSNNKSN